MTLTQQVQMVTVIASLVPATIGFWKHQHSVAIKGRGRAQVDSATLLSYLVAIENLWLVDPFQFGGNLLSARYDILSAKTSDTTELLNKQLLGTELNHVDGRGLSDNMALQAIILAWAEYLSYNSAAYSREALLEAKDLLDSINNSGE